MILSLDAINEYLNLYIFLYIVYRQLTMFLHWDSQAHAVNQLVQFV
jgi:hypothetical protein